MAAGTHGGRDFFGRNCRTDWEATAYSFSGREDIWLHVRPLGGEELTGAANTRLNFVELQQQVKVVTNGPNPS